MKINRGENREEGGWKEKCTGGKWQALPGTAHEGLMHLCAQDNAEKWGGGNESRYKVKDSIKKTY